MFHGSSVRSWSDEIKTQIVCDVIVHMHIVQYPRRVCSGRKCVSTSSRRRCVSRTLPQSKSKESTAVLFRVYQIVSTLFSSARDVVGCVPITCSSLAVLTFFFKLGLATRLFSIDRSGEDEQGGVIMNRFSSTLTQRKSQGASQAMLYATGLTTEDMNKAQVFTTLEFMVGVREAACLSSYGVESKRIWSQQLPGGHLCLRPGGVTLSLSLTLYLTLSRGNHTLAGLATEHMNKAGLQVAPRSKQCLSYYPQPLRGVRLLRGGTDKTCQSILTRRDCPINCEV